MSTLKEILESYTVDDNEVSQNDLIEEAINDLLENAEGDEHAELQRIKDDPELYEELVNMILSEEDDEDEDDDDDSSEDEDDDEESE